MLVGASEHLKVLLVEHPVFVDIYILHHFAEGQRDALVLAIRNRHPGCHLAPVERYHANLREAVGHRDTTHQLREKDLYKAPGIAETIDWAEALVELNCVALDPQTIDSTIGVLLKYQDDIAKIQGSEASKILNDVKIAIVTQK